jgi:transposase
MQAVIDAVTSGVPTALVEIRRLGRTLKQRAADVLAFFDHPGTSNGPIEPIKGRLEHLRGSALGLPEPHQLHRPELASTYTLKCDEPVFVAVGRGDIDCGWRS